MNEPNGSQFQQYLPWLFVSTPNPSIQSMESSNPATTTSNKVIINNNNNK